MLILGSSNSAANKHCESIARQYQVPERLHVLEVKEGI